MAMKLTLVTRYLDPGASSPGAALDPASLAVSATAAGIQGALGLVQTISGNARAKRLLSQRQAYQTPQEYFKILEASQDLAQQGYDPFTLNYLTSQIDRGFSSTLGVAEKLGANPNDLSAIFDQKVQSIMKVGAENHSLNMANFGRFLQSLELIGQNKEAEWQSRQDIIKDQLQAAGAEKAAGIGNISSAANAFIATQAASGTGNLYRPGNTTFSTPTVDAPFYTPGAYSPGGKYGPPNQALMDVTSPWNG